MSGHVFCNWDGIHYPQPLCAAALILLQEFPHTLHLFLEITLPFLSLLNTQSFPLFIYFESIRFISLERAREPMGSGARLRLCVLLQT
jgi:hypothetical protein